MAIRLIAFDFGSTTSKAIVASAILTKNVVTGRTEIQALQTISRAEPVFTPFTSGEEIDKHKISNLVEEWLSIEPHEEIQATAGGVIITGLAAKKRNAQAIAEAVRKRIGDAVVAVADSPAQESWLAFMGSIANLSASYPQKRFVNLDIGGGTTNLALGSNRTVLSAGSLWIGARHFQFIPGSYQMLTLSNYGRNLLKLLQIPKAKGDCLELAEVQQIIGFYVSTLECAITGKENGKIKFIEQIPFPRIPKGSRPIVTFSGGVGELIYRLAKEEHFATTPYGDLGVDLALGIIRSPVLSRDLGHYLPENLGRATVCGLAFHGVEASGSTIFLRNRDILPLRDLPLLGRISSATSQRELNQLIARIMSNPRGACLQAEFDADAKGALENLAGKIACSLRKNRFPKGIPLIIFIPQNLGKTFGNYATEWGRIAADLVVIDEIVGDVIAQKAYFATVNKSGEKNMLVSFYGGLQDGINHHA